ncbi:Uncharacterised protein [Mycobacterium tuberculosis]|nr:Uncharacterised protein [Mycobacterium tuberculosis]
MMRNGYLADQHRQVTTEYQTLLNRVTELEDDLTAARTSLRRMIRDGNLGEDRPSQSEAW